LSLVIAKRERERGREKGKAWREKVMEILTLIKLDPWTR